jgi:hypothetical protein
MFDEVALARRIQRGSAFPELGTPDFLENPANDGLGLGSGRLAATKEAGHPTGCGIDPPGRDGRTNNCRDEYYGECPESPKGPISEVDGARKAFLFDIPARDNILMGCRNSGPMATQLTWKNAALLLSMSRSSMSMLTR